MLMTYTVMIGWGLIGGFVPVDRALLLIAFACIAPVAAYAYGFLQSRDGGTDWGLLLSAIGWLLVAIALFVQHGAVEAARRNAVPGELAAPIGVTNGTTMCATLAAVCILAGAALSLQAWNRDNATSDI